jgi:dephospho-CoA kinase
MIIGICGRIGAGKTTTARALNAFLDNSEIYGFGDYVKELLGKVFDIGADVIDNIKNNTTISIESPNFNTKLSMRKVLQRLGTEALREMVDEDFWVKLLKNDLEKNGKKYDYIILHDVRFKNELQICDKIIYVKNKNQEQNSHKSEQLKCEKFADFTIDNSKLSIDDLGEQLLKILPKLKE